MNSDLHLDADLWSSVPMVHRVTPSPLTPAPSSLVLFPYRVEEGVIRKTVKGLAVCFEGNFRKKTSYMTFLIAPMKMDY